MRAAPLPAEVRRCRARLEEAIAAGCAGEADWAGRVAAAVRAAVGFAAADPAAALTLTERASARWAQGEPEFVAMVDRFAELLSRGAPPHNPRLPDARTVIARIARQINLELEAGRGAGLGAVAPDLTFLALMPYLGFAGARRWSEPVPARG